MAVQTKLQPQDLEAEQSLLGSMLLSADAVALVIGKINKEYFYKPSHGIIFEGITDLFRKNEPIDLVTVSNELKQKNKLTEIGGRSYLIDLTEITPTAANADYYSNIILENAMKRKLIKTSHLITKDAYNTTKSSAEVLADAQQQILEISNSSVNENFYHIEESVNRIFDEWQSHDGTEKLLGLESGFPDLDKITAGFQPGDLIILAARPAMGKTTLAMNFLQHIAIKNNVPSAFFSLEMPRDQITQRMLASEAKIDSQKLRFFNVKDNEFSSFTNAINKVSKAPIFFDDSPSLSPVDIRAKFLKLKATHDIKFVVIDYLQLLQGSQRKNESRYHEVSQIVRDIKAFAKEAGVPVIALSQLSRDIEKRTDKRPVLSDLRETGEIEQTSDLICFIHKQDIESVEKDFEQVELVIAKHRNGPTGSVNLGFRKNVSSFVSIEKGA